MRSNNAAAPTGLIDNARATQGFTLGYGLKVGLSALALNARPAKTSVRAGRMPSARPIPAQTKRPSWSNAERKANARTNQSSELVECRAQGQCPRKQAFNARPKGATAPSPGQASEAMRHPGLARGINDTPPKGAKAVTEASKAHNLRARGVIASAPEPAPLTP